uniref:Uncharacterized protein n=1 Tax=Oryza glumipatula TaxID=40148 RepID=A0A0E0BDX8_9ORYZ
MASLHNRYRIPSLSYDTGQFQTFAPLIIRSCCPSTSRFEMPMVDNTMHGGRNSMSIGYGSQYPWSPDEGVKNFTKLGNEHSISMMISEDISILLSIF